RDLRREEPWRPGQRRPRVREALRVLLLRPERPDGAGKAHRGTPLQRLGGGPPLHDRPGPFGRAVRFRADYHELVHRSSTFRRSSWISRAAPIRNSWTSALWRLGPGPY